MSPTSIVLAAGTLDPGTCDPARVVMEFIDADGGWEYARPGEYLELFTFALEGGVELVILALADPDGVPSRRPFCEAVFAAFAADRDPPNCRVMVRVGAGP